jgi:hypothetical protein
MPRRGARDDENGAGFGYDQLDPGVGLRSLRPWCLEPPCQPDLDARRELRIVAPGIREARRVDCLSYRSSSDAGVIEVLAGSIGATAYAHRTARGKGCVARPVDR